MSLMLNLKTVIIMIKQVSKVTQQQLTSQVGLHQLSHLLLMHSFSSPWKHQKTVLGTNDLINEPTHGLQNSSLCTDLIFTS